MTLIRRFFPTLPGWARADNPVMRYQLDGGRAPSPRRRALFIIAGILGCLLLVALGYAIATEGLTIPAGSYVVEVINSTLYWPLLALQLMLSMLSILLTAGTVSNEQKRQHWDNLRATPNGADLIMRTRWASVFYRLRGLLAVVYVGRIVLIICMLYDLTSFQGRYIDLLINGVVPEISVIVAVLLLALFMTAAVLLPITAVGLTSSIGLLVSTAVHHRTYSALVQILLLFGRVAFSAGLLLAATRMLGGELSLSDPLGWLLLFLAAALGDWGLALLYLGRAGEVWATVPFGILMGAALVVYCFVQAYLADQILSAAVRRAQRKG